MIPRKIHYCNFGNNGKDTDIISKWKKLMPDWEFYEWNEVNYDVTQSMYTTLMYTNSNYMYLSDYVRLHVLSQYGGIYLDTDVDLYKSLESLIKHDFVLHNDAILGNYSSFIIGSARSNPTIDNKLKYLDNLFLNDYVLVECLYNTGVTSSTCYQVSNNEISPHLNCEHGFLGSHMNMQRHPDLQHCKLVITDSLPESIFIKSQELGIYFKPSLIHEYTPVGELFTVKYLRNFDIRLLIIPKTLQRSPLYSRLGYSSYEKIYLTTSNNTLIIEI